MNLLSDIVTYMRRLIKSPSNSQITDALLIDYVNRFWLMDVDARIQLFDLRTKYQFQTSPGIDQYNMPLYDMQTEAGSQSISFYPVYQGFMEPAFVNGIEVPFYTERSDYFSVWPNYVQGLNPATEGNGTAGPYPITLPFFPALPGHVDITGVIATGVNQDPPIGLGFNTSIPVTSVYPAVYITTQDGNGNTVVVSDSGQFLSSNVNYGLLMSPGKAPFGNTALPNGYSTTSNTVNYQTGQVNVTFPVVIPSGVPINAQCYFYQQGLPRSVLYWNNCLQIRPPPDISYLVEVDAYLSPAAFLNSSQAIQFAYMCEYIARGAARKILADTGDLEQFQFYEPLFREQEILVWKRSQRQFTSTRTPTIFSQGAFQSGNGYTYGQT